MESLYDLLLEPWLPKVFYLFGVPMICVEAYALGLGLVGIAIILRVLAGPDPLI